MSHEAWIRNESQKDQSNDFKEHLKQFSKEPMADDMLYVINKMQREENTLAKISQHRFSYWWSKNRWQLIHKGLNKASKND